MKVPIFINFNKKEKIKKTKNKKFDTITIVLVVIVVIIAIIAMFYTAIKIYKIKNGKSVDDIDNIIRKENDIFDMESYYAQIEATVISNKNINTYNIKQYYIKNNNITMQRVEFKDRLENVVTAIYNGKDLKVISNNQKYNYLIQEYDMNSLNYLDIYVIIEKYKKIKEKEIKGKIEHFEKNNELKIVITYDNLSSWYNSKIISSELLIDKTNGKILNLVHYNNNKNIICNIKYNEFKINQKIEPSLFDF